MGYYKIHRWAYKISGGIQFTQEPALETWQIVE